MFGLFKRKLRHRTKLPLLEHGGVEFMAMLHGSLEKSDPASLSMWLVAYANLRTYQTVWHDAVKRTNMKDLPSTGDGFIQWLASTTDTEIDELAKRRKQWFFLASNLDRANGIVQRSPMLVDQLADMWAILARAGALLPKVYRQNQLWTSDEKEWFSNLRNERSGVHYVMQFMAPVTVRKHPKIKALADEYNIVVTRSPGRLA